MLILSNYRHTFFEWTPKSVKPESAGISRLRSACCRCPVRNFSPDFRRNFPINLHRFFLPQRRKRPNLLYGKTGENRSGSVIWRIKRRVHSFAKGHGGEKQAEIWTAIAYTGKVWLSGNRKRLEDKLTLAAIDVSTLEWQEMVRNHLYVRYDMGAVKLMTVGGDGGSWVGSSFDFGASEGSKGS